MKWLIVALIMGPGTKAKVQRLTVDQKYSPAEARKLAEPRQLLEDRLLEMAHQQWGDSLPEESIDRMLNLLKKEFASQSAFQALLQELGLDEATVRSELKDDLLRFKVLDHIYQEVLPEDTEVVEVPEERVYREIYIPAPPYISTWDRFNARLYTWMLWIRLKLGGDFQKFARKYSHGRTARLGGIREPIVLDPRNPISRTVFTLDLQTFSRPVETRWGFYLLYLEEVRPAHTAPFGTLPWRLKRAVVYQRMKEKLEALTGLKLQ